MWYLKDLRNKNVINLDLKTDSELLSMTDAGSEFPTDGVVHQKERFAKSILLVSCRNCGEVTANLC